MENYELPIIKRATGSYGALNGIWGCFFEQAGFLERAILAISYDNVINESDSHQVSCLYQGVSKSLIRAARGCISGRVIMHDDKVDCAGKQQTNENLTCPCCGLRCVAVAYLEDAQQVVLRVEADQHQVLFRELIHVKDVAEHVVNVSRRIERLYAREV